MEQVATKETGTEISNDVNQNKSWAINYAAVSSDSSCPDKAARTGDHQNYFLTLYGSTGASYIDGDCELQYLYIWLLLNLGEKLHREW